MERALKYTLTTKSQHLTPTTYFNKNKTKTHKHKKLGVFATPLTMAFEGINAVKLTRSSKKQVLRGDPITPVMNRVKKIKKNNCFHSSFFR